MGIVVYGIIEVYIEKSEYSREHWETFAQVEFNKNHSFVWALQESGLYAEERNWYQHAWRVSGFKDKEISFRAVAIADQDISIDSTWVTAEELEKVLNKLNSEDYDWKVTPRATLAFMRTFEQRYAKVRLLVHRS